MNPKLPVLHGPDQTRLRLGLCQIQTAPWDLDGNESRTLAALEEAAERGAGLAITPECVSHGYGFDPDPARLRRRLDAVAQSRDGPTLTRIDDLARRRRMAVVVGFVERGEGGRFHNAAAIISPDGVLLDVYRPGS